MKKSLKIFICTCVASFLLAGLSYEFLYKPDRVMIGHAEYLYDIEDKELVLDSAENVVVGTVVERLEAREDEVGVYTPYKVEIEEVLKGDLTVTSEILVSQRIGYDNKAKATVKMSERDDYLKAGESLIFSLRYEESEKVHTIIVPEYGNVKIKEANEESIDSNTLKEYKDIALKMKSKE